MWLNGQYDNYLLRAERSVHSLQAILAYVVAFDLV
jgi:hypothetical protein